MSQSGSILQRTVTASLLAWPGLSKHLSCVNLVCYVLGAAFSARGQALAATRTLYLAIASLLALIASDVCRLLAVADEAAQEKIP